MHLKHGLHKHNISDIQCIHNMYKKIRPPKSFVNIYLKNISYILIFQFYVEIFWKLCCHVDFAESACQRPCRAFWPSFACQTIAKLSDLTTKNHLFLARYGRALTNNKPPHLSSASQSLLQLYVSYSAGDPASKALLLRFC